MERATSYWSSHASSWGKAEANWDPWSEITLGCRPNHRKICLKKGDATLAALISLVQGQKITPFVRPWLTVTMTELNSSDKGNLEMRSVEIEENRIEASTTRGVSLWTVWCVLTLADWQMA